MTQAKVKLTEAPFVERLLSASQDVVDAISFDDNGAMIGGKWQGGNGGLLSRETISKADELRRAINAGRAALSQEGEG